MSTLDFSKLTWRKSSRSTSAGDNGECVEIAFTDDWRNLGGPVVAVRDSKNPGATPLAIPATAFTNFLRSV